jgi:hypothetical protein
VWQADAVAVSLRKFQFGCRVWITGRPAAPSGNDVGGQLILDEGDFVAQLKLALFQPLQLQDVGAWGILQCSNRGIQVAMLLLQTGKLGPQLAFFFFRHGCRCMKVARPSGVLLPKQ